MDPNDTRSSLSLSPDRLPLAETWLVVLSSVMLPMPKTTPLFWMRLISTSLQPSRFRSHLPDTSRLPEVEACDVSCVAASSVEACSVESVEAADSLLACDLDS
jgi:hypothetical protein